MANKKKELIVDGNMYAEKYFKWRRCLEARYKRLVRFCELDSPKVIMDEAIGLVHEAEMECEKYNELTGNVLSELIGLSE